MKKTTKFLLVLAAVVALTIGAVSTVMAADYPVINKWIENSDGTYSAETNGAKIQRGWAISDAGIYYYFMDGKMLTNTFVVTGNKTYFLNGEGAMHTGWIQFNEDYEVTFNDAKDVNVSLAFSGVNPAYSWMGHDLDKPESSVEVFTADTQYETVWCYFKNDGSLAVDEWEQVDGIWYFLDGPFCVMNDWNYDISVDENGKSVKTATYGFDSTGAMIAGWANYYEANKDNDWSDSPYEKNTSKPYGHWVYYGTNGKKVTEGWLKIGEQWFFMVEDDKTDVRAIANSFLQMDNRTFFFATNCVMQTGYVTLSGKSDRAVDFDKYIVQSDDNNDADYVTLTGMDKVTVEKKGTDVYFFNADGTMLTGIPKNGTEYFEDGDGEQWKIVVSVATDSAIKVNAEVYNPEDNKNIGEQWTESFLYVDGNGDVYYFYQGQMLKNEVLVYGDYFKLAFGSNGKLIKSTAKKDAIKVDGVKYVAGTEYLIPGVPYSVVSK